MGGARRRPMAAGEGQRHANELRWRGNPGQGGAYKSFLEVVGAGPPNTAAGGAAAPSGAFNVFPASNPFPFPVPAGKTYIHNKNAAR